MEINAAKQIMIILVLFVLALAVIALVFKDSIANFTFDLPNAFSKIKVFPGG